MRKRVGKNGTHERVQGKIHHWHKGLSHICWKTFWWSLLGNILWTDDTKAERFGRFFSFFPGVKATQHSTNMVVAEWSCVAGFRENPEGEHPFITSWPEAQEHLDCATGQRSKKIGKSNSEWLKDTKQKAKWAELRFRLSSFGMTLNMLIMLQNPPTCLN